jgi:transposase
MVHLEFGRFEAPIVVAARSTLIAPFVIDCPMNRAIFIEYLCRSFVPTLRPGDIVIIDNLPADKRQETMGVALHHVSAKPHSNES